MSTVGIYSFPKSGNTWMRQIIAARFNLDRKGPPVHEAIPDLHQTGLGTGHYANGMRFYKHHAGELLHKLKGEKLNTTHVIHIRRNPLDVFLSNLNFISANITGSAPLAFDSVDAIQGTELFDMYFHSFVVMGRLLPMSITKDYFTHNRYWLDRQADDNDLIVKCVRYEDLMDDIFVSLDFLNDWLALGPGELQELVDVADRRTAQNGRFFWKRQQKNFLNYLSGEQIELFWTYRGEQTEALGYEKSYFFEDQPV